MSAFVKSNVRCNAQTRKGYDSICVDESARERQWTAERAGRHCSLEELSRSSICIRLRSQGDTHHELSLVEARPRKELTSYLRSPS